MINGAHAIIYSADPEADRKRFVVSDGGVIVIGKGDTVTV